MNFRITRDQFREISAVIICGVFAFSGISKVIDRKFTVQTVQRIIQPLGGATIFTILLITFEIMISVSFFFITSKRILSLLEI
jgi:hypothetical protein